MNPVVYPLKLNIFSDHTSQPVNAACCLETNNSLFCLPQICLINPSSGFLNTFPKTKKMGFGKQFQSPSLRSYTTEETKKTLIMIYDCLFKVYDPAQILPSANHLGWLYLGFGQTHGQTSPKADPFLFHLSQAINYRQGLRLTLTISYISKQSSTDLKKKNQSWLMSQMTDCSLFLPLWGLRLTYT